MKYNRKWIGMLFTVSALGMGVTGCGGGGGGSDADPGPAPLGNSILYVSNTGAHQYHLYEVPADASSAPTQVTPNGRKVSFGYRSPSGEWIVYASQAEASAAGRGYLYAMASSGGSSTLLNPGTTGMGVKALIPGFFPVDPNSIRWNGNRLAFVSDPDDALNMASYELFVTDFSSGTPTSAVRMNGELVGPNVSIVKFNWSPDGSMLAYIAEQDSSGIQELFVVNVADPENWEKLNGELVSGGEVFDFAWAPNGSSIAYLADEEENDVVGLYVVDIANPGSSIRVNAPLVDQGDVLVAPASLSGTVAPGFAWSPNGQMLAYVADQEINGVRELFMVMSNALGTSAKVNLPANTNQDVNAFQWSPNSSHILYHWEEQSSNTTELYLCGIQEGTPGMVQRAHGVIPANSDVFQFEWSPDGSKVAYIADQDVDGTYELYLIEAGNWGTSEKATDQAGWTGTLQCFSFLWSPTSTALALRSNSVTTPSFDLYSFDLSSYSLSNLSQNSTFQIILDGTSRRVYNWSN